MASTVSSTIQARRNFSRFRLSQSPDGTQGHPQVVGVLAKFSRTATTESLASREVEKVCTPEDDSGIMPLDKRESSAKTIPMCKTIPLPMGSAYEITVFGNLDLP
jgi:hypothetical protein